MCDIFRKSTRFTRQCILVMCRLLQEILPLPYIGMLYAGVCVLCMCCAHSIVRMTNLLRKRLPLPYIGILLMCDVFRKSTRLLFNGICVLTRQSIIRMCDVFRKRLPLVFLEADNQYVSSVPTSGQRLYNAPEVTLVSHRSLRLPTGGQTR